MRIFFIKKCQPTTCQCNQNKCSTGCDGSSSKQNPYPAFYKNSNSSGRNCSQYSDVRVNDILFFSNVFKNPFFLNKFKKCYCGCTGSSNVCSNLCNSLTSPLLNSSGSSCSSDKMVLYRNL